MSTATLSPYAFEQFFDNNGNPLAGGFIWTYLAGTSTPTNTWRDSGKAALNTNPIVLDASGRCVIYLDALSYKFVLQDSTSAPIATQDGIGSTGLTTLSVPIVYSFFGDPTSPITATSYPSGTTFDLCQAGTSLFSIDSGTLAAGTYNLSGMLLGTAGTVTAAIVNLSDGAPDTPLATISSASTTGALVTSGPITFAAAGAVKTYGIKTKVTSSQGFAWALQLVKTA